MLNNQWQGEEKDDAKDIKFGVDTFSTKQILNERIGNQDDKDYRQNLPPLYNYTTKVTNKRTKPIERGRGRV